MGKERQIENHDVVVERTEEGERLTTSNNKLGKAITAGILLVTVGVTGVLVGLNIDNNTPHFNVSTGQVLAAKADTTTLDNVIEMKDATAAVDLDEVIKIVELSERLHNLNLDSVTEGLYTLNFRPSQEGVHDQDNRDNLEIPESYNVDEVNALIDQYEELGKHEKVQNGVLSQEDREYTRLALILKGYEFSVNNSLSNDAYHELANYGILCVKSKVLDACFFAPEEVNNMKIGSGATAYLITFDDTKTGKCYKVEAYKGSAFTSNGYVYDTIDAIYNWQDKANSTEELGMAYDGERNKDIIEGVNMLKTLTVMDCEINNKGQIKVTTSMKEVRDYVKTIGSSK